MRKIITPFIFLFSFFTALAQQAPQYSLYMFNKYNFNPAYAGLDNSLSITGVFRKQWVDLPGSPLSQNFTAHMPVYVLGGGLGINIENDLVGAERTTSAQLSYNYWIPLNKTNLLSVGVSGGMIQKSLDGTKLRAPEGEYDPNEPILQHNDGRLPLTMVNTIVPTVSAGIYLQTEKMDVGISANNLIESEAKLDFQNTTTDIQLKRNYFFIFAYNFEIGSTLTLHPSIFAKSDFKEHQIEISTILKYNDNIFGGASFRGYTSTTIDAVVLLAGFKLSEKISFAYAYDMTLSELSNVSSGSHEIILNYNLNKQIGAGVPPNIIYNPRFL